jgi:hypothetical protein
MQQGLHWWQRILPSSEKSLARKDLRESKRIARTYGKLEKELKFDPLHIYTVEDVKNHIQQNVDKTSRDANMGLIEEVKKDLDKDYDYWEMIMKHQYNKVQDEDFIILKHMQQLSKIEQELQLLFNNEMDSNKKNIFGDMLRQTKEKAVLLKTFIGDQLSNGNLLINKEDATMLAIRQDEASLLQESTKIDSMIKGKAKGEVREFKAVQKILEKMTKHPEQSNTDELQAKLKAYLEDEERITKEEIVELLDGFKLFIFEMRYNRNVETAVKELHEDGYPDTIAKELLLKGEKYRQELREKLMKIVGSAREMESQEYRSGMAA